MQKAQRRQHRMATRVHDPRQEPPPAARIGLADLRTLPPTLKPEEAFNLLGVGRTAGYELIRRDEVPALRLGGKLLVPTAPLLRLIGVASPEDLAFGAQEIFIEEGEL